MGVQLSSRGSGKRFRPMAEINVTPMVDVMLVLLIVFMVTAPLLTLGVPLKLPRTEAKPLPDDSKPLTVSVDKDGAVFLEDTQVDLEELVARLAAISKERNEARVYIRGDSDLAYGEMMAVVAKINRAGFTNVALVTDRKKESGKD